MADPTNISYKGIIDWAKGTTNDVVAKALKANITVNIKDNTASHTGTGITINWTDTTYTLKLPATIDASITGNAATATTATKLGATTVGANGTPMYLNNGTPTAATKVGNGTLPVCIPTSAPSNPQSGYIWIEP